MSNQARVAAVKAEWKRIHKEFMENAEYFQNFNMYLTKTENGYVLTDTANRWQFLVRQDGVEQLSERPDSSSEYWAYSMMQN